MPRITSRDTPRLHEAARLIASSRERRKADRCVLEGEHLVGAYCRRIGPPETLIVAEGAEEQPAVRSLVSLVSQARTLIDPRPRGVAAASSSRRSRLRATATTLAPSLASASAIARPKPREAPATRA